MTLLLVVLAVVPTTVAAQEAALPDGRNIEEVRVVGNARFDDDTIRFYLSSRPGRPFDSATAQLDYMSLFNTAWFSNLLMRWEEGTEGGIVVVVEVEELPLLRQVKILGTDKVEVDDFMERLGLLEMMIEIDQPVDEQALHDNIEVLTLMLQGDQGLQFVQVEVEIPPSELGAGVDAIYHVVEGDSVRIALVQFDGNTIFTDQELRWMMKRTGEHHFMSFLNKNDRYSMAGYEADMIDVRKEYMKRGYLNFTYGEPEVEVFEEDRSLWYSSVRRLALTIPIFEGEQQFVNEVRIEGNTHFTDAELLRAVGMKKGDVINAEELGFAQEAIEKVYTEAGYLQVAIAPFPEQVDAVTSNIVYRVQENAVYRVNRIEFEGNTHTRDFVLRRNLNLHELARWDQARYESSVERLWRLGYFQNVEPDLATAPPGESLDTDLLPDPEYGTVDVGLRVEEVGRNQISFGGGLSALEGGFVQFGYTTRNLLGYGQTVSLNGQLGKLRQTLRLSFADSYFLNKQIRFGADVFRDAIDYPDFRRSGTGFSVRGGKSLNFEETLSSWLEYNYEVIDIGDVGASFGSLNNNIFQSLFLTQGKRTTSSVRPFLHYSDVDNPYLASRGHRSSVSFEYAGGPLGGTLDFWKAFVRTTHWIPTVTTGSGFIRQPKQVVAVNVRADWAQPHGDLVEIPIFERFFLGGSNSVRGTRLNSIGPTDDLGNILGGTKALQYNLEYIFILNPSMRVKAFHDAGQAWLENESPKLGDMRKTVGVEVEVFMPVFNVPFRFFWAHNFDPRELFGETKSTFEFAIGSTF
jgi:outer membrane protein insertion porin family